MPHNLLRATAARSGAAMPGMSVQPPYSFFRWARFAISLAVFIAALEYVQATYMAPRFGYLGWSYHEPDRLWMLASYLLLLLTAAFLPRITQEVSALSVWFLYGAMLVPIATVPLYGSATPPADSFLFAAYCAAMWVGVALLVRPMPGRLIPVRRTGAALFWTVIVITSVLTYGFMQIVFGLSLNIMSVFDVYDTRLVYRDQIVPTVPLLAYLISNQSNVINPMLMAIGVVQRRWPLILIGAVGQLLIYSTAGYKTVLLSIPLCILLAWILRNRQTLSGYSIFISSTLLVLVTIAVDKIASLGIVELLVSRIFLTAGYLTPLYLGAYDSGTYALWDYSFMGPLLDAPYDTSPGFYVSTTMLGLPSMQANAGLFADGYANLGLAGIAIEALALVVILRVADGAGRGLPLSLVAPTLLLPIFSIANGSPFTAFLSFGFALMAVLFALYPRDEEPASSTLLARS